MHPYASHEGRQLVLHRMIGRGGFGEVYEGALRTRAGLTRRVAVKVLRADMEGSDDALRRLADEAMMLSRLRHPVVVSVEDLVQLGPRLALVSEYIEGTDLGGAIPLPPRAALEVTRAVAQALSAAWEQPGDDGRPLRIVHRDLKPGNIRLGRHGVVKLLDFGIATSDTVTRAAHTATGMLVGSLGYMAPERWLGADSAHPGDVYALGCVLFESLTGKRLHADQSAAEQVGLAATPDRHRAFVEGRLEQLPSRGRLVVPLLRRMLSVEPSERPTAAEVARLTTDLIGRAHGDGLSAWSESLPLQETPTDQEVSSSWHEGPGGFARLGDEVPNPRSEPPARTRGLRTAGLALLGLGGVGVASGAALVLALGLVWMLWPAPVAGTAADEPLTQGTSEAAALPDPPAEAPPAADPDLADPTPVLPDAGLGTATKTNPSPAALAASTPTSPPARGAPSTSAAPSSQTAAGPPPPRPTPEPTPPQARPKVTERPATPTGTVNVEGGVSVRLRGPAGVVSTGAVPVGTYQVEASFADGAWTGTPTRITVKDGATVVLKCSFRFRACKEAP